LSIQGFDSYSSFYEVRFGRKRIDVLMVAASGRPWIAIELKIRDWKKALWQSVVNRELADICFVALPERFTRAALFQRDLFDFYGVGLISVSTVTATIVVPPATV